MLATIIIILAVAADQITKYLALTLLEPIHRFVLIDGILEFRFVRNRGAAWGILADNRWVFMTISVVSLIFLIAYLFHIRKESKLYTVPISLIIGGGIGNMIDRLFYPDGAVVDFIYFKLIDFPVFNIADCAVTIGAAALVIFIIYGEFIKPHRAKKKENADENADMQ